MPADKAIPDENYRDNPTFWFVRLENSRQREDHEAAAKAIRELRRLGVNVSFSRKGATK
jgi:hypothetical protein